MKGFNITAEVDFDTTFDPSENTLTLDHLRSLKDRLDALPPTVMYLQQHRFPRSKKRRIQRKWALDMHNYKITIS